MSGFYTRHPYSPERSIGLLLRRVIQSVVQQVDRRLADQDLTHVQWAPLFKLSQGCDTVAALARELQTDPGAMTRTIDRLEAKGLLRRERDTDDRRVVRLHLSDSGRALAACVPPVLTEVLDAHLLGFSDAEALLLIEMLQRMLANGERLRGGVPADVALPSCVAPDCTAPEPSSADPAAPRPDDSSTASS